MKTIKGLWSVKTIYFICALALNYIEFLRATGDGDVWKPAANCTGLVMMIIVFSVYPLQTLVDRKNALYTLMCLGTMLFVFFHWKQHIGQYSLWQIETAIVNIWWLGITLRYLWESGVLDIRKIMRKGVLVWLWIVMVAWSMLGNSDKIWPLWFLLMFGSFYVTTFSAEKWQFLIDAMINGTICAFFFIQSYAYLFRPYDEARYKGPFPNCNATALYYVIVYVMILVKLHQLHMQNGKNVWKLFYFAGAGALLAFQFLTICRTAWITSIVVTIYYGMVVLRKHWGETIGRVLVRGCSLILCAVLTFFPVFYTVRYLPTIHPHPIWYTGEYDRSKVHSWDPADSEKYIEMDEFLDAALGKILSLLKMVDVKNPFVLQVGAQELDTVYVDNSSVTGVDSSIRVRLKLWEAYLKESTWLGHSTEDVHFAWKSNGNYIWHAQNVWVQFTYTYGYPVGVLFLISTIMLLFRTYKQGRNTKMLFGVMPFMLCASFFVFGLAEIVWNPGQYILTLFFFGLHPQFAEEVKLEEC